MIIALFILCLKGSTFSPSKNPRRQFLPGVPVIIKFIVAYTFIIISTISIRKLKRHVTTALFYYMYFKQHKIQREASASLIKFIKFVNESNSYGTVKYYGTALQPHILIFFNFKLNFLVFFIFYIIILKIKIYYFNIFSSKTILLYCYLFLN